MKKCLKYSILSAGVVLLLYVLGIAFLMQTHLKDPLSNALEAFYTEDLYYWFDRHNRTNELAPYDSAIVLVDIASIHSRTEIASLLDTITSVSPRAVIVDVVFSPHTDADKAEDMRLTDALRNINNLSIAVHYYQDEYGNWRQERSFFADSINATEGYDGLEGQVVRNYTTYFLRPDSTCIPSLGTCIAQALGCTDIPITTDQLYPIGYTPMNWMVWHVNQEEFEIVFLHDKVVVIGDCSDLRDYHNVPALSGGRAREAGTNIHIQIALNQKLAAQIKPMPKWLGFIIQCLFIWILCFWFCRICDKKYGELLELVAQVIIMIFVAGIGMAVFKSTHYILPLSFFLVSVLFVPAATNIVISTSEAIADGSLQRTWYKIKHFFISTPKTIINSIKTMWKHLKRFLHISR